MKKLYSLLTALLLPLIAGLVFYFIPLNEKKVGTAPTEGYHYYSSDVVGTHIGTSTVGVDLTTATSSYISKIGGNKTIANYTVYIQSASTTSSVSLNVQGSNDDYCDTTATSTAGEVLMSDINWFNAGRHLAGVPLTDTLGSDVFTWTNPSSTQGDEVLLTNLNYECLKLNISGSSSTVYVGLRTK